MHSPFVLHFAIYGKLTGHFGTYITLLNPDLSFAVVQELKRIFFCYDESYMLLVVTCTQRRLGILEVILRCSTLINHL